MENTKLVYFDNAATTKPLEQVVKAYTDGLLLCWPNPSSSHILGQETMRYLDKARVEIARNLNASSYDVIFTSGASEANNLAIKGYAEQYKNRGKHIIVSAIEHPSILNSVHHLESLGYSINYVHAAGDGKIHAEDVVKLVTNDTILVSIMAVNNETGLVNDIKAIKEALKPYGKIALHCDAVQGIGKTSFAVTDADMVTISLHKLGGLKSTGLLLKKSNINLVCQNDGGGQENGLRSGTNDVAMALADVEVIKALKTYKNDSIKEISDLIYDYLESKPDEFEINSTRENPYILNFSSLKKKASIIVEALAMKGIMVGSHSACSSKAEKPSYVLVDMSRTDDAAKNSIRLSFGRTNTIEEAKYFIQCLDAIINEVRG